MKNELIFALAVLGYGLIAFAVAGLAAAVIEAISARRQDGEFKAYRIVCGQPVPIDEVHKQELTLKQTDDKCGARNAGAIGRENSK